MPSGLQERLGSSGFAVTFGWAYFPDDGDNALTLYRAANERLYARKILNGRRHGSLSTSLLAAQDG